MRPSPIAAWLALFLAPAAALAGPGLGNLSYGAGEVFTVVGHVGNENGAPRAHGTASIHKGYLATIFSRDSGEGQGGFAFHDLSNPRSPVLVFAKDDSETFPIREGHGYGASRVNGRDYVVLQATEGVQFWDWTDVSAPVLVNYLKLPGVAASDYGTGAWWAFWAGSYVYVGGSGNGLFVLDAHDPATASLVDRVDQPNPIPTSFVGSFKTGPVSVCGELLVIAGMNESGITTMDVSDPVNPRLISSTNDRVFAPLVYSGVFNGGFLYGAGVDQILTVHDLRDPRHIVYSGKSAKLVEKGGYVSTQGGFAFLGASQAVYKVDVHDPTTPTVVGQGTSAVPGRDEDFATVIGNLIFDSDDHGNGTAILPHQAAPDTTPPHVNFASPAAATVGRRLTTRIGLSFDDEIDFDSVDATTFIVRKPGGATLPGQYSYHMALLNFQPAAPLEADTTYEVVLPAGGIKDAVGNPLAETYVSIFSTGPGLDNPLCNVTRPAPTTPGDLASFSVSATGSALTYSWNFGDGTPATAPSASGSIDHAYAAPGRYTIIVEVNDATGPITSCSVGHVVHRPLTATPPRRSGTLALDVDRHRLWVVSPDHDAVSVLDTSTNQRDDVVTVGKTPRSVALAPSGDVWVLSDRDAEITVVDAASLAVKEHVALPPASRPMGLVFAPDGSAAWVTLLGTGRVLELDPATGASRRELVLGGSPRGLAISGDGQTLLVTRFLSPDDHAEVSVIDASALTLTRTEQLGLDAGPDREDSGRGLLNYLRSITISPDGERAWVPAKKDNVERGGYVDGLKLTFESTVRSTVAELRLAGGEEVAARHDLNDRGLPVAVEFSRLGDLAFVASEASNTVDVLDAYRGDIVTNVQHLGAAPDGLLLSPDGARLYVHSFLAREVTVLDVSQVGGAGNDLVREVARVATVAAEVLTPEVLAGKRLFYDASDLRMSRDGYLACAVCHLDGEHDGRTWDFSDRGEGLRNTITLAGKRGVAQGPLHWTANFDEVQDFENDIRNGFSGHGFMSDADFAATTDTLGATKAGKSVELDQLAAYVTSLDRVAPSPFRDAQGYLTPAAVRGKVVFEGAGCPACHAGPDYTISASGARYDVGTITGASGFRLGDVLDGFDVPTLVGVWATAPYFHDGSAATLDDVVARSASLGGKHGAVAALSADQKADLAELLREIDGRPLDAPPVELDGGTDGGAGGSAGAAGGAGATPADDSGCGCRTAPGRSTSGAWLWLLSVAAIAARAREWARSSAARAAHSARGCDTPARR